MKLKAAMVGAVLWPAFVGAALGDGILFKLIDPDALEWFGTHEALSRQGAYTIGFFYSGFSSPEPALCQSGCMAER